MGEVFRPSGRGFRHLRALGAFCLAVLLYVLLVDAAIETFWSGSLVKWWVTAIVAAYLGISVWLSRKLEWATIATASFFTLVGLLALTVWLPGGLTDGLRLVGLSTSTLLSVVTAVAVAFSGIVLFRLNYPHPAIKWGIRLLVVYGVIAFLWAPASGTEYPDLFRGQSFSSWLPRVLQGSFIGAAVLVLAILHQLVSSVRRTSSIDLPKRALQVLGLVMSLVIAVAALIAPVGGSAVPRMDREVTQMEIVDGESGSRMGPVVFVREKSGAQPISRTEGFYAGTNAVSAFLDFEGLRSEDTVNAVWYKGAEKLVEQTGRVSEFIDVTARNNNRLWFTLDFKEGAKAGFYLLEISVNGALARSKTFPVDPI